MRRDIKAAWKDIALRELRQRALLEERTLLPAPLRKMWKTFCDSTFQPILLLPVIQTIWMRHVMAINDFDIGDFVCIKGITWPVCKVVAITRGGYLIVWNKNYGLRSVTTDQVEKKLDPDKPQPDYRKYSRKKR
jgi:hypothetical protein